MTVIAYDGKAVTVDSRVTEGDRKRTIKKWRRARDGRILMVAGFYDDINKVRVAFDHALDLELPVLNPAIWQRSDVLVWDGKRLFHCDSGAWVQVKKPDAWGSGSEYAMGALSVKADSRAAALAACKHSSTCGGPLHTFTKE